MMLYSKHTNMELLAECWKWIADLIDGPNLMGRKTEADAVALREELRKRTKGVTFRTDSVEGDRYRRDG